MKKEQFTCSAGNDPRHKYDFAEPWDESEDTKDQAAYRVTGDSGCCTSERTCATRMDALELSCDSGEEVNGWDTDNPFSSEGKDWDAVTVAEVKEACCRATCQSVFASDATIVRYTLRC